MVKFVNPLFLIGLAGAALPVLIHLLTRDRIRKVSFSTLRFFAGSSQRVLRRKRFQEAILLALRMAICALLAVAFARPFLHDPASDAQGTAARKARVIVADVSGSMARGSAAAELKRAAQKALGELSEGTDAAALITFADDAQVSAELSRKFDQVNAQVEALSPGQGGTNLPAALKAADDLLKNAQAGSKEIVLISDLQRSGWSSAAQNGRGRIGEWRLSPDVKLLVQSLAPAGGILPHADLAIIDHYCPQSVVPDQTPQPISVKVANRSDKQMDEVPVTLTVGGKVVGEQKVTLRADSAMLVQFRHVFDTPGDNPVTVHVGGDAANTPDNTVFFNARVLGRIPVVVLNGAPSANRATDAAFFLTLALSPKQSPPFEVRTIEAGQARPEDLQDALVVFVADADKLRIGMDQAIYDLLQRGGGVMFLPGGNVSAESFNAQFAGTEPASDLAPCRLKAVLETEPIAGEIGGVALSKIDFEHPVFRDFAQPHHGDFSTARFFRWWEARDYQGALRVGDAKISEALRPRILARFEDGRPAILERQIGRGISMLLASSTDLRWTNFAEKAAVFQPFIHLTAKYLSIRSEPLTAYAVGQPLPAAAGMVLKDPSGKALPAGNVVARQAGFYWLSKDGTDAFCYAVNTDPQESDAATVTADEIVSAVQRPAEELAAFAARRAGAVESDGGRFWWYVLVTVGVLFALELFVANRTLRH